MKDVDIILSLPPRSLVFLLKNGGGWELARLTLLFVLLSVKSPASSEVDLVGPTPKSG